MIIILVVFLLLIGAVYLFFRQPQFGRKAIGKEWERIQSSPHLKNGQFRNLSNTPQLTGNANMLRIMKEFFFNRHKRNIPPAALPSKKTDLFQLDPDDNVLVWFGHSSYFLQLNGKKFLIDPVLSGHASPVNFTGRSFKGSDVYTSDDIPLIDYLLITHDHYDHLDYKTVAQLKPKITKVITALGVGAHLQAWGFDPADIVESDWGEEIRLEGLTVYAAPARHFSGRTFQRNISLWLSFALITPVQKIFIGGDSGYDGHFRMIAEKLGPFDLAVLENGQYNDYWKYIHMVPEETVQAALDLKAKRLLPVHWAKFSLSLHAWDEPIIRLMAETKRKGVSVLHPMIGEAVYLDKENRFTEWWNMKNT